MHIVDAPVIGGKAANWGRECKVIANLHVGLERRKYLLERVIRNIGMPSDLGVAIPQREPGNCGRSAGMFPFGFGRKTIVMSVLFTQPTSERDRIVLTNVHHRVVRGLGESRLSPRKVLALPNSTFGPAKASANLVGLRVRQIACALDETLELTDGHFMGGDQIGSANTVGRGGLC